MLKENISTANETRVFLDKLLFKLLGLNFVLYVLFLCFGAYICLSDPPLGFEPKILLETTAFVVLCFYLLTFFFFFYHKHSLCVLPFLVVILLNLLYFIFVMQQIVSCFFFYFIVTGIWRSSKINSLTIKFNKPHFSF